MGVWAIVSWEEWVRHNRLFAAGLAAALMLGAASPALADAADGKGKAKGHVNKPEKSKPAPPLTKGKKGGISGGGSTDNGDVSIQARPKSKARGHFNFTSPDGLSRIRCRDGFTVTMGTGGNASVAFSNCQILITGQQTRGPVTVAVFDAGQHPTPPAADTISISYGQVVGNPVPLTGGNIKVRP